MIGHYLKSAFAKFRSTPFTTAANVLTLALGLACFIAAYGIATYWRNADSYHHRADDIYFLSESINAPGATAPQRMNQIASHSIAQYLPEDFPEIESVARARSAFDLAVAAGDRKMFVDVAYADPAFLDIFDLEFVQGEASTALQDPDGVVLTKANAERLFGDAPALGQSVILDGQTDGTVTGVIGDIRQPSFMSDKGGSTLNFSMIRPWMAAPDATRLEASDNWLQMTGYTFLVLKEGTDVGAFRTKLPVFLERRLPPEQSDSATVFLDVFPISKIWTLYLENSLFPGEGAGVSAIGLILGLGVLMLVVACANYANLATAQSIVRAREIGMRKVLGARRSSVMAQAWTETGLLSLLALLAALVFLALAAPAVRSSSGIDLLFFASTSLAAWLPVAGILIGVAVVAGAYPALRLSGARPAEAIGHGRSRAGSAVVGRILVGVQFLCASFLLIMLTVSQLQREEVRTQAFGSGGGEIVALNPLASLGVDFETLEPQLKRLPGVRGVTIAENRPWSYNQSVVTLARTNETGANAPPAELRNIGYDYFPTLDLDVRAGRVFGRDRDRPQTILYVAPAATTPSLVIDEAYARRLGFSSPEEAVGQIVYVPEELRRSFGMSALPVEIIGVVENETTSMEASDVVGHIYSLVPKSPLGGQYPILRVDEKDIESTLLSITGIWDRLAPDVPVNIQFSDELFEQRYATFARIGAIFLLLASVGFVISTMGLLGIAVHAASRRRHEIAVRKTLGSSVAGVVRLLLTDFSIPVLIGNLLAWPLAYLAAQTYLSAFSHRIDLTLAPFALSMAITLAIAWTAVIGVVLRAASVRPAEVMRHA